MTTQEIMFYILSACIGGCSILAVTSRRMLRAVVALLFVLMATAGLYLLLNYEFLAAVQLALYAGGILVLIVFSILLTSHISHRFDPVPLVQRIAGWVAAASGFLICAIVIFHHQYPTPSLPAMEVDMQQIGRSLLHTERDGYVLPFEVISVLLMASMIGSIVIARKNRPEEKKEE